MRWHLLARSIVIGVCLAGCATLAGINDGEDNVREGEAGLDGPGLSTDEAGTIPEDSSPTPSPCAPGGNAAESESSLHATKVSPSRPVVVNGEGAEWACVDRLAFTVGQRSVGLAPDRGVADVAMQWDETHLYLWAKVTTESAPGTAARLTNFNNDSFHLFLASTTPKITYTNDDHHIVIDVLGQVADYAIATRTSLAGIDAKAGSRQNAGALSTFVVEAKVDATIIGRTSFAQGDMVRVNFQINDQPDIESNYRIWFRDVAVCTAFGTCDKAGGSEPFCDPRCTGTVVLR